MIVADTSSLITLATADTLSLVLEEYDIHTTETVVDELEETAEYDDHSGEAASQVLDQIAEITVHNTPEQSFQSSRMDTGEGSTAAITHELDADFLLTDDLRALPELQTITDRRVAISLIILKALVERDVVEREQALDKPKQMAAKRGWLGAPIYRRAQNLFGTE